MPANLRYDLMLPLFDLGPPSRAPLRGERLDAGEMPLWHVQLAPENRRHGRKKTAILRERDATAAASAGVRQHHLDLWKLRETATEDGVVQVWIDRVLGRRWIVTVRPGWPRDVRFAERRR